MWRQDECTSGGDKDRYAGAGENQIKERGFPGAGGVGKANQKRVERVRRREGAMERRRKEGGREGGLGGQTSEVRERRNGGEG